MIASLSILNFLSHKKTIMEFSEGVNVIVGVTDSGKSAIIKALKWIVFNRPAGEDIRSSWGGVTVAKIIVDDGILVKRLRSKKANSYFVDDKRFDAVKRDVPEEVLKVLNFTDINLQTQFDSHFMLSKSSGEVAQYFNKIAHLDKIDIALQNIQRWTRDVQKKLGYDEQAYKANEERLASYSYLKEAEAKLLRLEEKDNDRRDLIRAREEILKLVDADLQIYNQLEKISFLQELEESVNNVFEIISEQKQLKNQMASLTMLLTSVIEMQFEEKENQATLNLLERQFHKALGQGSVCPLCGSLII